MAGFNRKSVNLITAPKGTSLNYREKPTTSSRVLFNAKPNRSGGRTTGDYFKMPDGVWWRVLLNDNAKTEAYVREDVTRFIKPASNPAITKEQAQKIVNKLVSNDIEILDSLVNSGNILKKLDAEGKNVSSLKKQYGSLLARHSARQEKIRTSKLLSWKAKFKEKQKQGLAMLKMWAMVNYPGIYFRISGHTANVGAIPVVAVVIGAVVGVGLAVSVYLAFKPSYSESQTDLKLSKELEKALNSLSPQAAQSVKNDLEKQVDKAYNQGKTDGTFSGVFKILKPIGLAIGSYWLVTKFLDSQKERAK